MLELNTIITDCPKCDPVYYGGLEYRPIHGASGAKRINNNGDRAYMQIKKITSQHRRDFQAIYECEHCSCLKEGRGYDDVNFHRNVIPEMKCPQCGKTAPAEYRPLMTKYPDTKVV